MTPQTPEEAKRGWYTVKDGETIQLSRHTIPPATLKQQIGLILTKHTTGKIRLKKGQAIDQLEALITREKENATKRREWREGEHLYMVECITVAERATITSDMPESKARKEMNDRLDRTIKLLTDPKSLQRLTTYCPNCNRLDNQADQWQAVVIMHHDTYLPLSQVCLSSTPLTYEAVKEQLQAIPDADTLITSEDDSFRGLEIMKRLWEEHVLLSNHAFHNNPFGVWAVFSTKHPERIFLSLPQPLDN